MHYQGRGLGLHEQGILEPLCIISNPTHQGLGYSEIRESNPINDTSIILGENLSKANINIESTKNPYDEIYINTTTSNIMNHHPHIFKPSNWDQQQEKKLY